MKRTGHTGHVFSVAISPDSERIASGGEDGTIRLWDLENRRLIRAYRLPERESMLSRYVNSLAFSPDGRRILSGGVWVDNSYATDGEFFLWRVPDELGLWLLGTQEKP